MLNNEIVSYLPQCVRCQQGLVSPTSNHSSLIHDSMKQKGIVSVRLGNEAIHFVIG